MQDSSQFSKAAERRISRCRQLGGPQVPPVQTGSRRIRGQEKSHHGTVTVTEWWDPGEQDSISPAVDQIKSSFSFLWRSVVG